MKAIHTGTQGTECLVLHGVVGCGLIRIAGILPVGDDLVVEAVVEASAFIEAGPIDPRRVAEHMKS